MITDIHCCSKLVRLSSSLAHFPRILFNLCIYSCVRSAAYSTMSEDKRKPFTVFVEGNIGSGKTTFLKHFEQCPNTYIAAEPVEQWRDLKGHNLLELMYKDPSRWGLTFQTMVQKTMLDVHVQKCDEPIKLMERSIHSARHIFVENLFQQKIMSAPEYAVLDSWFEWISSNCDIHGDLIVYLKTSPEVVYERMKARARQEEHTVSLEYLQKLHVLHENWLIHKTIPGAALPPIVVVDANQNLDLMAPEFKRCQNLIFSHLKNQSPMKKLQSANLKDVPDILSSPSILNETEKNSVDLIAV
nr:PREDICTED: deoxynucleoside kinase-like [Bemisia tabaci]